MAAFYASMRELTRGRDASSWIVRLTRSVRAFIFGLLGYGQT
jgi:hypothetical protein